MQKHNLFAKKLKKQILSINVSLESYFNKLKNFNLKKLKAKIIENNKLFWGQDRLEYAIDEFQKI